MVVDDRAVGGRQYCGVRVANGAAKCCAGIFRLSGVERGGFEPRLRMATADFSVHAQRAYPFASQLLGHLHVWPRRRTGARTEELLDPLFLHWDHGWTSASGLRC